MKKFLTVLLALSVVFTYTVGTAFALPSDGTETAGLNAAKTQALTELNEQIDNISDYTEAGQLIITGKLADYTAQINAATTINGVTSVLNTAKNDLTIAKNTYLKTAVADALTNALKQIKDYLYLFGYDVNAKTITDGTADMTIKTAVITNGNVDLDSLGLSASDKASFTKEYTSQITKLKAAVSTDDVEESLNDVLKVIDKYLANLTSAEVTDAERTALVNEIIGFANSKNVSTSNNYSSTIVNKYDAMVEEAVAAAKAVQTKAEYYEVINKYLGTEYTGKVKSAVNAKGATVKPSISGEDGYVVALDGSVYIFETTLGELLSLIHI